MAARLAFALAAAAAGAAASRLTGHDGQYTKQQQKSLRATKSCTAAVASDSEFTGTCTDTWATLKQLVRPTQPQVGYAWVSYKLDKDFSSEDDAQAAMDEGATPAVLGTAADGTVSIFFVDDHHTLSALDASGYTSVTVTVQILCDLRNLTVSQFWDTLVVNNQTFLASHTGGVNVLPGPISYADMPTTFSFTSKKKVLSDDPWRSLAGFSRKVKVAPAPAPECNTGDGESKYCERAFYRGCGDGNADSGPGVSFFEFRWAYFYLDAYLNGSSAWPSASAYSAFANAYEALPATVVGRTDTDAWLEAAGYLVPLARATGTGDYILPATIFPGTDLHLPGFTDGYTPLPDDPDCDAPTCTATA